MLILRLNNRADSGEYGAGREVVRHRKCAGGFSLMEVLFAVVILTLGLVFVAANFPVGIMNASKVAESTRNIIDAHNAEVMVELQLGAIVADPCTHQNYSLDAALDYISNNRHVRLLPKPNVLVDYYPLRVVIDNPEGDTNMGSVVNTSINWLFWSDDKGKLFTDYYLGDIGPIVSPAVDVSDRDVQKKLQMLSSYPTSLPLPEEIEDAIFEVSMERKNSWCVLYRQVKSNIKEFCFYVFTLRSPPHARYAMQGDFESTLSVEPRPSDVDRRFPVPWRIDLDLLSTPYWGHPDWPHTAQIQEPFNHDRFIVPEELANLLQTGSILIDRMKGHRFEVVDVYLSDDNNGQWYVRVNPSLELWMTPGPGGGLMEGVMGQFWFFPPPIVRLGDGYSFEGKQPVVKVTRKIMRF